jgi:hypothetical protein
MSGDLVIAAVGCGGSVLGSILTVARLSVQVGVLIGTVNTKEAQNTADHTLMRSDILQVRSEVDRHEQWHMSQPPQAPR